MADYTSSYTYFGYYDAVNNKFTRTSTSTIGTSIAMDADGINDRTFEVGEAITVNTFPVSRLLTWPTLPMALVVLDGSAKPS